ncbi:MMPL family transporter [Prauserella endophytica]|uniref:MMPL family transporter n=1 Tax=Prauserella endophytica TaxID=1592324 RepID=A0ABY2S864_9PSEU|nr:MMPL family transporter [Prauserella endophytica]TKG71280.1 MMPL family transporter [Prauserella endophytica]
MFARIGRFAADHARAVLAVTLLVLVGAGALGFTAFGKLQAEGFTDPSAESTRAADLIDARHGGSADLVFLVTADTGTVDDPAARQAGADLTARLAGDPALTGVTSYFQAGVPALRSDDGTQALIAAHLADEGGENTAVEEIAGSYTGDTGAITVDLGGRAAVGQDVNEQVGRDLLVAESIAVPVILILLVLVFGSVVAALLPLAIGGIAILGTFAELSLLGSLTDVSVFAINLTTGLGLGLAIDYALLMVSRFREQLAAGSSTRDAVIRTVETAGRTITFGAVTVAVALSALLLFPQYFLRSFAYAGIGVVLIAMLAALFVLPALLAVLGQRVNAGRLPWRKSAPTTVSSFWGRVARTAGRRPWLVGAPAVLVLVLAAAPLLRVEFGTPDDRVLPTTASSRIVGDALREQFPGDDSRAVQVVTTGPVGAGDAAAYTQRLAAVPGVADVVPSAQGQRYAVITEEESRSESAQRVVEDVRALPAPPGVQALVGGDAAVLLDSTGSITDRLPLALGLIALTTFVLLFLFTGSVLQPLRALVFNVLGLSATLGVMVLIFQDGALSGLLGFTPLPLDTSMLMLLFCIAFGLSMDYEVFVLSRIKEAHDRGLGNREAVVDGLSRTGRIVSMAAVLLAVSFFAFGTSGVSFIQMFGLGSGLAILIDATIIRGLLVPAGMRLLGDRAWWAPAPLRRLHDRLGISEAPAAPPERPRVNA